VETRFVAVGAGTTSAKLRDRNQRNVCGRRKGTIAAAGGRVVSVVKVDGGWRSVLIFEMQSVG
jgi:hypothetical protein